MRLTGVVVPVALALGLAAALAWLAGGVHAAAAFQWAAARQLQVQNAMAGAIRAIQAGQPHAVASLCALAAGYGFVHALGPGHGKVVLGGAAMASRATAAKMFAIGAAASLAQALAAIVLVAVGVRLFSLGSADASRLAEGWLATASRVAIALIGAALVWRGLRALTARGAHHHHHHHHHCGCDHNHGPAPAEVARAQGWRETAALVGSVAARPCTGAIFLLVIAWRFGIPGTGALAVLAMGCGTAAFNALAITGGLVARRLAWAGARADTGRARAVAGGLQVAGGLVIVALTALPWL
ncbi:nickel/cobalt transporter [Frigidibacter sp. MR17.24]|uniref:nickel/cobalt transporter n=1 Tax=Frigidibacter sp. MR17.24 TaxID=3127345 RepID=UPI003013053F